MHVLSLMAMGIVRNKWLNDAELQVRSFPSLRLSLHNAHDQVSCRAFVVEDPLEERRY